MKKQNKDIDNLVLHSKIKLLRKKLPKNSICLGSRSGNGIDYAFNLNLRY